MNHCSNARGGKVPRPPFHCVARDGVGGSQIQQEQSYP